MLKKFIYPAPLLGLIFLVIPAAHAAEPTLAIGPQISTMGLGIVGIAKINTDLSARLSAQTFSYDISGVESGVDYDADLKLMSGLIAGDWFPAKGNFRITAGALINGNELEMTGKATGGTYTIGDTTYTAAEVGNLDGTVEFNNLAPYLGIGWGNPFNNQSNWSFSYDIGVVFQGSPDVSYNVNGTLANNAAFRAELEKERQELENELDEYQYYPVLAVGLNYRF
ncbi:MAG: hypothetical protein OEL66_10290 [Desulfobulbaceae bacterium]|nr:hypothetical protein [Desulfobulbaceae bacterium]